MRRGRGSLLNAQCGARANSLLKREDRLEASARLPTRGQCPRDADAKDDDATRRTRSIARMNARTSSRRQRYAAGAGGKTGNDPSAGSPTETLLRLLLPLNVKIYFASRRSRQANLLTPSVHDIHRNIQSVGATGGVYKGQGRNQCKLMTCVY